MFGEEPWSEAVDRSAAALARRVEQGGERGVIVAIEAHIGSLADTPDRALELLGRTPGLTLTLDPCHFNYQGYPDEDVEPLIPFASHYQFRFSAPGRMQVRLQDNTIDFPRIVRLALRGGYEGFFGLELVWMEVWECDRVDNVSETIRLRDLVRSAMAEGTVPAGDR